MSFHDTGGHHPLKVLPAVAADLVLLPVSYADQDLITGCFQLLYFVVQLILRGVIDKAYEVVALA